MAGVVVVSVTNRFTLDPPPAQQAERLKSALLEASREQPDLIVDATRMDHIFSFEVAILVQVSEQLRKRGGQLALCGAGEKLLLVIEMLGLSDVLSLHPDVDACLAANAWTRGEDVAFELEPSD